MKIENTHTSYTLSINKEKIPHWKIHVTTTVYFGATI